MTVAIERAARAVALAALATFAAACASERPAAVESVFDSSAGYVDVEVLGDGFVRVGDRRLPLEAFVLEMRQATRRLERDELLRFVVQLRLAAGIRDGAAAKVAQDGLNRLVDELYIMGVSQIRFL